MNLPEWPTLPPEPAAAAAAPRGFTHRRPAAVKPSGLTLPDGRPLLLTISRKSLYVQLTQSLAVTMPDEAMVLLFLASPDFDPEEVWQVPAPADTAEPDMRTEQPNVFSALRLRAEQWADATFDHTQLVPMWELALALWNGQQVTATQPVEETPGPEKKSSGDASPTGVNSTPASSAAETSPAAPSSSTDSPSGTPTPPSTHGA